MKTIDARPEDYDILTRKLRKVYKIDGPSGQKLAVNDLSLGVSKG